MEALILDSDMLNFMNQEFKLNENELKENFPLLQNTRLLVEFYEGKIPSSLEDLVIIANDMKFLNCKRLKEILIHIKLKDPKIKLNENLMHDFREIPEIKSLFEGAIAIDSLECFKLHSYDASKIYKIYENIIKHGAIKIFTYFIDFSKVNSEYLLKIILSYSYKNPRMEPFIEIILGKKDLQISNFVIYDIIRYKNMTCAKFLVANINNSDLIKVRYNFEYLMIGAINVNFLDFVKYLYELNSNFNFNEISDAINTHLYDVLNNFDDGEYEITECECYYQIDNDILDFLCSKGFCEK